MKTAEDWQSKFIQENGWGFEAMDNDEELTAIKQIQLDALKEGMRRAAFMHGNGTKYILTVAEQLTLKDL